MTPPNAHSGKTKAEIVADYREAKAKRGECRDCRSPAKRRTLRDGTVKILKLCTTCAAADAARKAGQIR